MYNIKLAGLDTGRTYYVKVRAKVSGYETSEWSMPFKFETPMDTMPPGRPENVSFISEGDSFIAKWQAPQFNEDGSNCGDISHYRLIFKDLDRDITREERAVDTSFTMDFNRNVQIFGSAAGRIELTVSAVDLSGNEGKNVAVIAQNPPPAKVQNVSASVGVESIGLKWDENTENDLANYEVHVGSASGFTPSSSTLRAKVAPGTNTHSYDTASLTMLYFKIIAVDKFNQKSTPSDAVSAQPRLATDYDKTPPGAVAGLTATQSLMPDNANAVAKVTYTGLSDADLDKYEIQYRKTGETIAPWSFATIPSDQTSAEIKPLPLSTSYDFKIRAVDFNSNKGAWSSVVVAPGVKKTTLPAAPTGVTVRGGSTNLMITWTASTDPSMANWAGVYEVQISKAATFTTPTTIKTSSTLASFINLDANTVYYARIRSIDPFGNIGAWSTTTNGNTGQIADANASRVIWSDTAPTGGKTNDLWIKTPENVQYRYNGTTWIKAQDTELTTAVDNVRQTADGKNKVWYQTAKPPLTSNSTGDIWFDTDDGNKMYVWSASTNDWVVAQDAAIQDALDNAADAQQTADGKNTIYYSTPPATGVREGDTWFDNSVIKVYKSGAWVDASTALDNAKANQAIQIAGSKNKTYYVAKASATGMIEGDILFDTADGNKQYRYNGTTWVAVTDAAIAAAQNAAGQAQQTADKKNTIYYATPPAGSVLKDGDVWFDGAKIKTYRGTAWVDSSTGLTTQQAADATTIASGKTKTYYVAYASRPTTGLTAGDLLFDTADKYKSYRYNGSAWESVRDGTIADAQTTATNAATAAAAAKTAAELRAQTFYEETGPANTNSRLKVNDLWIRSTDNQLHRWTGSVWAEIQDDAIALTQANLTTAVGDLQTSIDNVQAIADGKINTFISNTAPTQGLDNGDIWFDTSVTPVATKVYDGTNWIVSGDKAALDAAAAVQTNLNATNTALNKKNTTYAQTSAPTAGLVAGDIWLDTTLVAGVPKNEMNRWSGSAWVKVQDKTIFDVQALADGKAMVFTKATMPTDAESDLGDIWFDTSTTPWGVKVRTGAAAWTVSGDKTARDAATTAQTEAARKIQSFYTDTDPATITANNVKAGDLWYKIADKRARVRASNNTWVELKDSAIKTAQDAADAAQASANTAITNAGNAFNLADGKAQVFWGGTRPSNLVATDAGDIWVDTAKTPNEIQVWSGTEWTVTGDPATKAIADAANTLAGTKAYTYFGGTKPTASSTPAPTTGDIWINTAKTPHEVQIYNGTAFVIAADQDARTAAAEKAYIFTTTNSTAPTSPTPKRGDVWIDTSTGKTKIRATTAWVDTTDPEARNIANSKITTYYNGTPPTAPTGGFTTGDLWVRTTDNRLHRWAGSWVELKDSAITTAQSAADAAAGQAATAIANAGTAFDLADKKAQIFYGDTRPTNLTATDKGDIWVDQAKTPNEIQTWTGTTWVTAGDPGTKTIAEAAQTLAGQKAYVYTQTTTPTSPAPTRGDTWIHTTTGETKIYSGSAWIAMTDPEAQSIAKRKITTYYDSNTPSVPTGGHTAGDLWVKTPENRINRWSGTAWIEVKDAAIDAAQAAADAAAAQAATGIANAQAAFNLADGKAQIFRRTTAPTGLGVADEGDIWVDTSKTPNETKMWTGTTWVDADAATKKIATDAATLAGTKSVTFVQPGTPTGMVKGDIWINTTAGNNYGQTKVYSGSAWVDTKDVAATDLAKSKAYIFTTTNATAPTSPTPVRGDVWINTGDGKTKIHNGTTWVDSTDPEARNIANQKTTIYYAQDAPTTPKTGLAAFIEGDMWVRTTDNRVHIRTAGVWKESADTSIKAAQDAANAANAAVGNLAGTVGDLTTQVDNKVEVWFQTNQPAVPSAAADRLKMKGDIWINTSTGASNGEVKMYPGTGTTWNVVTDPAAIAAAQAAKDVADSKRQVFGGELAPSNTTGATGNNLKVNDLWIRDSDKKMHRWGGSAWEIAQDNRIAAIDSKGSDLIANGTGVLGNNINFKNWTFDPSDAPPGARGSFSSSVISAVATSDADIPYDANKTYLLSYEIRKGNPDVTTGVYAGLMPVDAYGSVISPGHYMFQPNTTTKLAVDLKPGDTTVKVLDASAWNNAAGNGSHLRTIILWNYVDQFGKSWPEHTYSRNSYHNAYADGGIDKTTNTITLSAPWAGGFVPAGTSLSNGSSGSTYMYSSFGPITSEWTRHKKTISGAMSPATAAGGRTAATFESGVPPATAFVKFFVIVNHSQWSAPGSVTKLANVSFSDATAAYAHATSAMDSANARNRSVFSTGNATGTSLNGYSFINGDMWYKKDANNTIIGMWEFLNGAWVAKTVNNEVIANLDAGKINAGTINADRIGAGSISASKLQISDTTNVIPNNGWEPPVTDWNTTNVSFSIENNVRYVRFNTPSVVNTLISPAFALQSGEYTIEFEMRKISGTTGAALMSVLVETATLTGARIAVIQASTSPAKATGTIWEKFTGTIIIPANVQRGRVWLETGAVGNHGIDVRLVSLRKKVGSTLIENGAITTEKVVVGGLDGTVTIKDGTISADELAANSVIAGKIATGAIVAGNIQTGQINAGHIISEGIDGTVVIKEGTLTASQIKVGAITGDKIASNTIEATSIKAGSIVIGAPNSPLSSTGIATPTTVATAKSEAISTAAGDATTKANAAQAAAIQAAATDAQTKADNAKAAAEQAAKDYADGQITQAEADAIAAAAIDAQTKADAAKQDAIAAAATDATSKANQARIDAINAAATDAQTKADAAKAAAEQAAQDYADGEISSATAQALIDAAATAQQKADAAKDAAEQAAKGYTDGQVGPINTAVGGINTKLGGWSHPTDQTFINGGKIYTDSITAGQIAANAIGVSELAANAVTADKIAANSVSAQKLIVGTAENMVNDPTFIEAIGRNWQSAAGFSITTEGANGGKSMKLIGSAAQQISYNLPENSVNVEAGTKIRAVVTVKSSAAIVANAVGIALRLRSATGTLTYPGVLYIPAQTTISAYKTVDLGMIDIPTDGTLSWYIVAQTNSGTGTVWFDNVQVMRAVGTTVIADNAITTGKIVTDAVTALKIKSDAIETRHIKTDAITSSKILAGEIKAINIDTGAITAGKIAAGAITIGADKPILPGTVAIPSDVTAAEDRAKADAKSKADAAQAAAIQAAATDAQTKADAAKTAAEAAAKQYADGQITQAEADAIAAAAADAQTKADAAKQAAEEYARSIQGGGVNLVNQSWIGSSSARFLELRVYEAVKNLPLGTKVAYSFDVRSDTDITESVNIYPYQATGISVADSISVDALPGEWKRYSYATTVKQHGQIPPPPDRTWGGIGHYVPRDVAARISVRNVKLEIGDVATPFDLSPADVAAQAEKAKTDAIANADSKINPIKNLTDGWTYTGTTEINGGKIKADTIEAAQIATGAITIGKIAPNTVAVPSDVTNAVNPINNTLDAWSTDNRTYINGGAIKTQTIDATSIKANSIVIGAANSPIANVPGSTIQAGTVPTSAINSTQLTTYIDGNTKVTAGNNAATTLSGLTALDGGVTVIDGGKIKTDSITALQIATNAITVNELAANAVVADSLTTNMILSKGLQIQSALTINAAGGHIKSSNWNDSAKTGFYMDQQQLIVHNGRIEAAAIKLQDSSNIMPPTYASFNARESAYAVANMWTSSVSGITKFPADGKFGGDSLQAVITANTGFIGMGHNATDLNIPIEGGKQYIISFYVSNRSSKVITLQPELYQTASILIKATATSIANSTAWTRYSMFVTAPATMTRAILRFNLTVGATATFRLDGIQVEQKIGQETAPSNWSPPGFTSIDGESITTGAISSNQTINTGNGAIAKWSINTNGDARFADATIDGKLIVGGYGTNDAKNANVAIQSDQYSAGIAGWAIKGNGDVEFNNGTFRGILNLGTSANESVKPTMTASVSSIKLYTDETTAKDINVASIQGVTYAYTRTDQTATGTFVPDLPNVNKAARYYIGPTTDKAVNIQVHDGPEDRAVYVSNPPTGVTLTSLKVGELTNPGAQALDRERQGFGYVSTRAEQDPDTPNRKTNIRVEQSSGVQLRSPFYPEVTEGNEYPESTHVLRTNVDFKAPLNKNLIFFSDALPDSTASSSVTRVGRTAYNARAYAIENGIAKSAFFDVSTTSPAAGQKHIFSTYVDTLDATDSVAVYAFANNTPLKPLGPDVLPSGQTEYQHTVNYANPEFRYELESNAASISNAGSLTTALTRTHGTPYVSPPGALYSSGNVRYTAAENYSLDQGMSLSMWISPNSSSGAQVIFHRASDTTREIWINYEAGTRTFSGGLNTGTAWTWAATSNLVPVGQWTHVTFVIPPAGTGSGNILIYIDGQLGWTSPAVPTTRWNLTFTTQPYYLFANQQVNSWYIGAISEPMIYRKMITAADVQAIYNSGNKVANGSGGRPTLSQNGILMGPGNESNRVAFEYTPSTTTSTKIAIQMVGPKVNKIFIYKLQLEKASYMDNQNLPQEIRNRVAPTPWTTNGSSANSSASLVLRSEPAPDAESWAYGSLAIPPNTAFASVDASKKKSPAELELSLSSAYTYTGGPSSGMTASATYKWSTMGVSYPGSRFPYLPTAASIYWDYSGLASTARPQIGGAASYLKWTVNNTGLGAINIGGGRSISDDFNRADESDLAYPWVSQGNPEFILVSNYTRRRSYSGIQSGIPENFVYHSDQLETVNQEVTIKSSDSVSGSTWRNNTVLICNYDPGSGDGIFFRNKDHSADRKWELFVVAGGVVTYSTGGTYSTAMPDGTALSLSRNGNRVTLKKGAETYFNSTLSVAMPDGRSVGFTTDSGINDDFAARDLVAGSTAHGLLRPESVNVNNDRGISVTTDGTISVNAPGYYMVTASVGSDLGGDIARTYWLWMREYIPGGYRDHRLGGPQNRSANDFSYISGSTAAYMTGTLDLIIETDTSHIARIEWAEMQLVRVA